MVECSTTLNCSVNSALMSARDCCVASAGGLAYSVPGQEGCHICIGMLRMARLTCTNVLHRSIYKMYYVYV